MAQYQRLQVKELIRFASAKVIIEDYSPKYQYHKYPNREGLCNIVNTFILEEFQKFVNEMIEKRKEQLIDCKNLGVKIKPELADLFRRSQVLSSEKGKSHFLTKNQKINKA